MPPIAAAVLTIASAPVPAAPARAGRFGVLAAAGRECAAAARVREMPVSGGARLRRFDARRPHVRRYGPGAGAQ